MPVEREFDESKGYLSQANFYIGEILNGEREISFIDPSRLAKQHKVNCDGGRVVYFPHPPYKCQEDYIRSVIKSLDTRTHAALESPTGTGKTLCLLASTLAWLHDYNLTKLRVQPKIQIVYTSRTHSQLAQVKKELLKTPYRPKCVTIASRDHYCINREVRLTGFTVRLKSSTQNMIRVTN